jgi:hypothetical protein
MDLSGDVRVRFGEPWIVCGAHRACGGWSVPGADRAGNRMWEDAVLHRSGCRVSLTDLRSERIVARR